MQSEFTVPTFINISDALPVNTESEVEFFGSVVLGLKPNIVERCIASTKERADASKGAAKLLRYWLECCPESTAEDLLTAMRLSNFDKTSVHCFEEFLKIQEYVARKELIIPVLCDMQ